ncbi:hypothetical protein L0Z13_11745 [Burkholderia multivorans]|uniref:hypothetical protein n=1 Tax=Burkholderia multivorans TaxID=87883 RepID=UPI0009E0DBEB|nr:hypothetical protein [Burkholderia multivorans]MCO1435420.1 hypothetical protein [Burkholderia multivorans]UQN59202.1 hypothetical protein L0Y94_21590 [Burkholderia multivorans]UQN67482.1 hypothetical protein L0Y92_19765 [Burkholderia multivorans]UQO04958.1 hypothetical protein L0Z13_11420 [Burkholderia multivorans]UQO05016.1 hypothetical protein L0Z13_11745 [Burkholderia multivorans]
MSAIANKRALAENVRELVRKSAPDVEDIESVRHSFETVLSALLGTKCHVRITVEVNEAAR